MVLLRFPLAPILVFLSPKPTSKTKASWTAPAAETEEEEEEEEEV